MSLGPISNAIGSTHLPGPGAASRASVASANDQIRQDKQQLDDWTTCVSAKTTKGQAEIQRLSGSLAVRYGVGIRERQNRLTFLGCLRRPPPFCLKNPLQIKKVQK
jgi:hypothetical protein